MVEPAAWRINASEKSAIAFQPAQCTGTGTGGKNCLISAFCGDFPKDAKARLTVILFQLSDGRKMRDIES
jgi:hypothetical protein